MEQGNAPTGQDIEDYLVGLRKQPWAILPTGQDIEDYLVDLRQQHPNWTIDQLGKYAHEQLPYPFGCQAVAFMEAEVRVARQVLRDVTQQCPGWSDEHLARYLAAHFPTCFPPNPKQSLIFIRAIRTAR